MATHAAERGKLLPLDPKIHRFMKGKSYVANHKFELTAIGACRSQFPPARP
jgi:hypothetical protein